MGQWQQQYTKKNADASAHLALFPPQRWTRKAMTSPDHLAAPTRRRGGITDFGTTWRRTEVEEDEAKEDELSASTGTVGSSTRDVLGLRVPA